MAQYSVTMSCGHKTTVALFGPEKDRARKIKRMQETCLCDACNAIEKAKQAEKLAEQSTVDAAKNQADGLPSLEGSPKQIAWAETIRMK